MFADYHIHSHYSDDTTYRMEDVVRDAIALGLDEICFTDHVDYGVKTDCDSGCEIKSRSGLPLVNVDYPRYMEELTALQEKYAHRIRIRCGMEFGVQTHTIPQFRALFDAYGFDFVLLSIHQVEDMEFWTQDFQIGRTQREYNERYYQELLDVVRSFKNYSVLAHVDLIARYDLQGTYPFASIRPWLERIFETIIADGKGIEFNTSWHRYGLSDTQPSRDILELYRDMGGSILTIGSDSHCREHLAAFIQQDREILRELGFRTFHTFDHMQPIPHPL